MKKVLVKSENTAKAIIELWNSKRVFHNLCVSDFEKFPAVLFFDFFPYEFKSQYEIKASHGICYEDDFKDSLDKLDELYES